MSTPLALDCWNDICTRAMSNEPDAKAIFEFVEFKGVKNNQSELFYTDVLPEHRDKLLQLGFGPSAHDDLVWTLPEEDFRILQKTLGINRAQFHKNLQKVALKRLNDTIRNMSTPVLTHEQRLALFKEFIRTHDKELGSAPLYKALRAFLKYQLKEKQFTAEWKMGQYTITQDDPDFIEDSMRLLYGVLGFELLHYDDHSVAILMPDYDGRDNEPELIWRFSPYCDNRMISDFLKCIPHFSETKVYGSPYQLSTVKRIQPLSHAKQGPQGFIQWVYGFLSHCLSFLLR